MMTTIQIDQEVERYMALPYRIELVPDPEGWFVEMPELPGCMSQGKTVEEAMEMIRDAQRGWLTVKLSYADAIPEPAPRADDEQFSGKVLLRLPKEMHRTLAQRAEREGVSLNLYLATMLAGASGYPPPVERKAGRPKEVPQLAESPAMSNLPASFGDLPTVMDGLARGHENDRRALHYQLTMFYAQHPPKRGSGLPDNDPLGAAWQMLASSLRFLPWESQGPWMRTLQDLSGSFAVPVRE